MTQTHPSATPHELEGAVRSRRIVIQNVCPSIDCGRHPVKREVGDALEVTAEIFKEGHGSLQAVLKLRPRPNAAWTEVPLTLANPGLDLWTASAVLDCLGRWQFTIEAWEDDYRSWASDTAKKRAAGQDVRVEMVEGMALVDAAVDRAPADSTGDRLRDIQTRARTAEAAGDTETLADVLLSPDLHLLMERCPDRSNSVSMEAPLDVVVDPVNARYAAWYGMFPRSQGTDPTKSATFDDCIKRIPDVAAMGFDVLYFVPIHPIGEQFRKGKNNSFPAKPGEPGSPYAIGSRHGGHTAVDPDLGTLEDFRRVVQVAGQHGMAVALDIAIQCSQDHPWLREHPEWFVWRPDGTIKYAENPPKKYQDIVNVNFYGDHQKALWEELRDMFLFWCDQGVRIFRVDNPHTKPVPFWEWCIREVKERYPDTVFLAEAFTRPTMLKMLAKIGFSQSYTYFTWRNFKGELEDFLRDLVHTEAREYLRPNFFTSTPDILPDFLQRGGRPAFMIRAVLAATLSSVYGIYNGFELCENRAVPGKEEYLDSEKYQYKVWDWDRPGNIKSYLTTINRIRHDNPALHELHNLEFHHCDSDSVLFYSKTSADDSNMVFVAVNLDPFETHDATLDFPLDRMGLRESDSFAVEELFTGVRRLWRGSRHSVTLDPAENPAAVFRVRRWKSVDYVDPCYG